MDARLLNALDDGTLIVTAHRRQARQIRFRYAACEDARNIRAWETPRVVGWDDWLRSLAADIMWSGYCGPRQQRTVLSPFQEQVLWEDILRDTSDALLADLAGAARSARQAWGLIQAYRLPDPGSAPFANADASAFSVWMRHYHQRCSELSLLDHARLADSVAPALRAGAIETPAGILLAGFDELTPQQRSLLKTFENLGTRLGRFKGPRVDSERFHVRPADIESEYRAAACWVRARMAEDPGSHTAVLIPELSSHRRMVERIFDAVLMPGSSLPGSSFGGRPYNVAVGMSFHRYPLVAAALDALALLGGHLGFAAFSAFLRSPFTRAAGAEQPLRARFDVWLRDNGVFEVPTAQAATLLKRFGNEKSAQPSVLATMLEGVLPLLRSARGTHDTAHWAGLFRDLLGLCGWPGDVQHHSGEFQTAERLRALLDEFGGMGFVCPPMSVGDALRLFGRLCRQVGFQPQTPELAVDLLEPDQAFGLRFDNTWICGWHSDAWPATPRANPFVPLEWQREQAIPHSTAETELAYAKRLVHRLFHGAQRVVVSAPLTVDEREVGLSPLVAMVPAAPPGALDIADVTDFQQIVRGATELETFDDPHGPPLMEYQLASGGTRIFELQAQCPFRAFAELRLSAAPLAVPRPGLNALERGNLVHQALEHLWRRLNSLDVLRELSGGEHLSAYVREAAEHALQRAAQRRVVPLAARYVAIEERRLVSLLEGWLALELQRAPFSVSELETEQTVTVGKLSIRARADRIDSLEAGGLAIIDYKTGTPSIASWLSQRPDHPQLPIYALAEKEQVAAVAFGRVRTGEAAFIGYSARADQLPGVKAFEAALPARQRDLDWSGLLRVWRDSLTGLAEQFVAGAAEVDPKTGACRYCHLGPLCRVNQAQRQSEESDDE